MRIKDHLQIAIKAAKLGGRILKKQRKVAKKINNDYGKDYKIKGDLLSEQKIIKYLKRKTNYSIIAEESGEHNKKNNKDYSWIIDPLDGTLNYVKGIPLCCVSIALWKNNKPYIGVIFDFNKNDLYYGIVKKGAWLNKKRIFVNNIKKENKAVLCTGFPVNTKFDNESLKSFIKKIQNFKKVRLLGSAALSLAYVASGKADIYMENNIMIWDVAAGLAIVISAGGNVNYTIEKKGLNVIASNKLLENKGV